jgi:hypothetical protein
VRNRLIGGKERKMSGSDPIDRHTRDLKNREAREKSRMAISGKPRARHEVARVHAARRSGGAAFAPLAGDALLIVPDA